MKDQLDNTSLWRKKLAELPVTNDSGADWLQMRPLLDQHMPVSNPAGVKKIRFKGFKFLPSAFVAVSAAAMIYLAVHVYHHDRHAGHQRSYKNNPVTDSVGKNSSPAAFRQDSLSLAGKAVTAANRPAGKPASATHTGDTLNDGQSINNRASVGDARDKGAPVNGGTTAVSSAASGTAVLSKPGKANPTTLSHVNGIANRVTVNHNALTGGKGHRRGALGTTLKGADRGVGKNHIWSKTTILFANNSTHEWQNLSGNPEAFTDPVVAVQPSYFGAGFAGAITQQQQASVKAVYQLKSTPTLKSAKSKNTSPANPPIIDWGIIIGANSSGSFTAKGHNANFYGSAPVDIYPGLFASVKLDDSWAINPQVKFFSPETISTTYTHANQSKVDSGQSLSITASRKIYAISVPLYAVYKTGNIFSFKAGPVINFPVKQINTGSLLQPASIKADSAYYAKTTAILNITNYQQNINLGISGGISAQFKRWVLEGGYLKSLSGYRVSSGLGSARSTNGTLQFSIGFQIDKIKH